MQRPDKNKERPAAADMPGRQKGSVLQSQILVGFVSDRKEKRADSEVGPYDCAKIRWVSRRLPVRLLVGGLERFGLVLQRWLWRSWPEWLCFCPAVGACGRQAGGA